MIIPFVGFWILLFFGRSDLGFKGVLFCIALWVGLLAGFIYLDIEPYYFTAAQAFIDVILILIIFKGDIRIR
jgi:hypothetical protein